MELTLQALGMLCALGSLVFATSGAGRLIPAVGFGAAFGTTLIWTGLRWVPDPTLTGMLVVGVAAAQLARAGFFPLTAASGGILAGVWVSVLRLQGVPAIPALTLALAVPVVALFLASRRPMFAPLALYEEALLLVAGLGLVVAAGPAVASGWQSAAAMNVDHGATVGLNLAPWIFAGGVGLLGLGGCYSLWWRRR